MARVTYRLRSALLLVTVAGLVAGCASDEPAADPRLGFVRSLPAVHEPRLSLLQPRVEGNVVSCQVDTDYAFAFDSYVLSDTARSRLSRCVETFRASARAGNDINVTGYTDGSGEEDYNLTLSRQRAQAVADWLENQGVSRGFLKITGKGESEAENSRRNASLRKVIIDSEA